MEGGERYFHVIINGVGFKGEKSLIFNNHPDKIKFLYILNKRLKLSSVTLHAFVLMDTHAHFLLSAKEVYKDIPKEKTSTMQVQGDTQQDISSKLGSPELNRLIKRVLSGYGGWFNKKYNRVGMLFETPHTIIEKKFVHWQLDTLLYILINPVEAGVVIRPSDYLFCSYKFHVGKPSIISQIITVDNTLVKTNFKNIAEFKEALESKISYQNNMKGVKYKRR